MAKRKAVRGAGRKPAAKAAPQRRSKSARSKRAAPRPAAKKHSMRTRPRAAAGKKNPAVRARKRTATTRAGRRATPSKTTAPKRPPRAQTVASSGRPPVAARSKTVQVRRTPSLDRPRRTISEEEMVPSPPSSLDLNRRASSVRSGRRELHERYDQHTETSPELTGGDIDANWESAYSVGDEAPGGDNPTPDQDVVEEIGHAIGVEYQDNEELKGAEKISDRDRHRWELDPASADDYEDR